METKTVKIRCTRCNIPERPGYYGWGAVINGVIQFQGVCFRCDGAGYQRVSVAWAEKHGYIKREPIKTVIA